MSGAQGDDARGVVVVVLMGAEHQVCREMQGREAWDIIVLIGVEDHGKVLAGQGKAGVAVPAQGQLFHGKTSFIGVGAVDSKGIVPHFPAENRGFGQKVARIDKKPRPYDGKNPLGIV